MKYNLSESEKQRIRKLHQKYSIKEQENKERGINIDVVKPSDSLAPLDIAISDEPTRPEPKGKAAGAGPHDLHVFTNCKGTPTPFVPTSSGLMVGATATQVSIGSQAFYSMVGSPSPGDIVLVNVTGGHAGMGPNCMKYVGIKQGPLSMHQPLDINGGAVSFGGQYTSCALCPDWAEYDCEDDMGVYYCNQVPAGQGQFTGPTALADCQANCPAGQQDDCISCSQSLMSNAPVGQCSSLGAGWVLYTASQGPICYECQGGKCTGPSWGSGGQNWFNSQAECAAGNPSNNQPACTQPMFKCVTPGQPCQTHPAGTYPTQVLCDAACQIPWKCTQGPQGCIQNQNGQYPTQADCVTDCCLDKITNWNWAPMPNPTCQAVCAKLNTPAMVAIANGTSTNFIHQCRYDWLVAFDNANGCNCTGVNAACCSDPNFAVGAAYNNDPLGCITQAFVGTMNNFVNNSPGWPNQGCTWLQDRLNNALSQQANYPPTSGAYCKYQGKINFLNNFMSTGVSSTPNNPSGYLSGPGSFPAPPGC